jgi:hypothetical protein
MLLNSLRTGYLTTLKSKLQDFLWITALILSSASFGTAGFWLGVSITREANEQLESHENCRDTPTHDAWISKKGNLYRCFMEGKEYPHRSKGSSIIYD